MIDGNCSIDSAATIKKVFKEKIAMVNAVCTVITAIYMSTDKLE